MSRLLKRGCGTLIHNLASCHGSYVQSVKLLHSTDLVLSMVRATALLHRVSSKPLNYQAGLSTLHNLIEEDAFDDDSDDDSDDDEGAQVTRAGAMVAK